MDIFLKSTQMKIYASLFGRKTQIIIFPYTI